MTFPCEDQVSRVHVTYSIGTAYQECHQQIPEDREEVRLVISQYLQDPEYLTLLLKGQVTQNKPFTLSSITVLFRSGVKWVTQSTRKTTLES